ncbi:hypothetical protein AC578_5777 [Pseudocercospora eumusae]|uniref:Uncharacterized protein n=1 Tax=Pseudocercospora eumusae TaxID=321146 RepID=A0A139H5E7_9PEZI|nr:hypothetical protein AC578_5777 [Pseudocercospora eumusae]
MAPLRATEFRKRQYNLSPVRYETQSEGIDWQLTGDPGSNSRGIEWWAAQCQLRDLCSKGSIRDMKQTLRERDHDHDRECPVWIIGSSDDDWKNANTSSADEEKYGYWVVFGRAEKRTEESMLDGLETIKFCLSIEFRQENCSPLAEKRRRTEADQSDSQRSQAAAAREMTGSMNSLYPDGLALKRPNITVLYHIVRAHEAICSNAVAGNMKDQAGLHSMKSVYQCKVFSVAVEFPWHKFTA